MLERRLFRTPEGRLAKATLVGAKIVKGPLPERVLARPASCIAVTSVEKLGLPSATPTHVCSCELDDWEVEVCCELEVVVVEVVD